MIRRYRGGPGIGSGTLETATVRTSAGNGQLSTVADEAPGWDASDTLGATGRALSVDDLEPQPRPPSLSGAANRAALGVKRLMDIGGAIVGMILLSPLLLGVAAVILVTDGRPVLFRQPRVGLRGRVFNVVKFRTMTKDADGQRAALREFNEVTGAAFKMTDDPRITAVGGGLRRLSLDELPQLWNVLLGEMSLVGPRPHPLDDVAEYQPWHRRRLAMKPGITGLWQIAGRRDSDFDAWVRYDLEYIDHWSLWLDLRLLIQTIPALLRAEGR
jgi:lipopolysaccharide/colanic/teichoic acid biosynthesis glycosyltransferase